LRQPAQSSKRRRPRTQARQADHGSSEKGAGRGQDGYDVRQSRRLPDLDGAWEIVNGREVDRGCIVEHGRISGVLDKPQHAYAVALPGSIPSSAKGVVPARTRYSGKRCHHRPFVHVPIYSDIRRNAARPQRGDEPRDIVVPVRPQHDPAVQREPLHGLLARLPVARLPAPSWARWPTIFTSFADCS
jgi:hypothetical protein